MRVILINPPLETSMKRNPVTENLFFNSPPLGLGYLASYIEKYGYRLAIVDAPVERLNAAGVLERIKNFKADIIGVTATLVSFQSATSLAGFIKSKRPELPIIIGGPMVSADPGRVMASKYFDIGVLGEGELTFLELVRSFEKHGEFSVNNLASIKGICYRDGDKLVKTAPRERIENLDTIPFPARHLFKLKLYRPQPNDEYRLPKSSIISSRGCPYGCIFCDKSVFGKKYVHFSAEYIWNELEELSKKYGIKDVAFLDSTFNAPGRNIDELVEMLIRKPLDITWTCSLRVDQITKEQLKKFKAAKCWRVRLGIETGNEKVLRFIKKGIDLDRIRKVATWADEIGLQPKAFFTIGHLIDTRETIEDSINFALSIPLKDITVQINTPLVNTPQYEEASKYGKFILNTSSQCDFFHVAYVPNRLSVEIIEQCFRKFYWKFYLSPAVIWRHLKSIRCLNDIMKYLRAFKLIFYLAFQRKNKQSRATAR